MKIGILGGSFNPIHNGHIALAKCAKSELNLDKIILMPTSDNPFKDKNINVGDKHRYEMTLLAAKENSFTVSDIEIKNKDYSYTVDTLTKLKQLYPNDDFTFIGGADIVFQLERWKDFKKLFTLTSFAISLRAPYTLKELNEKIKYYQSRYSGAKIYPILTFKTINISSSEIREKLKLKQDVSAIVPKSVYNYIKENNLYI